MSTSEISKFSELPNDFRKLLEAEKIRDCILVSLANELGEPKEQLDNTDILDVVIDAVDVPIKFVKSYGSKYWDSYSEEVKTSRILEQIPLLHALLKRQ